MGNKYVDFVSDEHFEKCVKKVCDTYNEEIILNDLELQRNGIDSIKMTFDMICEEKDFRSWKIKESYRQKDKTVGNAIGRFHQELLGGVEGWTDLGDGDESKLDLKKNDNTIWMELKNKDNTINGDSGEKVREKLLIQIKKHNAVGYFAYFVPKNKKSEDKDWMKSKGENHRDLRRISGSKVYELVTGKPNSLEQVWKALPLAIKKVCQKNSLLSKEEQIEFHN